MYSEVINSVGRYAHDYDDGVSIVYTFPDSSLLAILARPIVQKLRPGNSMILGGILGSVGCIGATFATDINTLIICIGVITGTCY
jgi:hypothetical protein